MVAPPMLWVGGAPGAGKSTLARTMSRAEDLPLHPIDAWTYAHAARLPAQPPLDEVLARGGRAAADDWWHGAGPRLELVLADLADRGLGDVPALVDGPQLSPAAADELGVRSAVWLIPTPERTRRARTARLTDSSRTQLQRVEALVARDTVIAEDIRDAAGQRGQPMVEVGTDPDWPSVASSVRAILQPALDSAPRLSADGLRRQRRYENETVAAQVTAWAADARIEPPEVEFACECGRSGCARMVRATAWTFTERAALGPVTDRDHVA